MRCWQQAINISDTLGRLYRIATKIVKHPCDGGMIFMLQIVWVFGIFACIDESP